MFKQFSSESFDATKKGTVKLMPSYSKKTISNKTSIDNYRYDNFYKNHTLGIPTQTYLQTDIMLNKETGNKETIIRTIFSFPKSFKKYHITVREIKLLNDNGILTRETHTINFESSSQSIEHNLKLINLMSIKPSLN